MGIPYPWGTTGWSYFGIPCKMFTLSLAWSYSPVFWIGSVAGLLGFCVSTKVSNRRATPIDLIFFKVILYTKCISDSESY